MLIKNNSKEKEKNFSAKDCVSIAVFVAIVIAVQVVISAVPGVELVTVLFGSYSFVAGAKKGMISATAFTLIRQIVFGFFPTVLILYLIYFNLLTLTFGVLGKKIDKGLKWLPIIVVLACVGTVFFTLIDCIITAFWYNYSMRIIVNYAYASMTFMIPQIICTVVSVSIFFPPLIKIFKMILN